MEVTGKVALVSGGASGIGLAITEELLKSGIKGIVIADVNTELGERIQNELGTKYGSDKVIFQTTDVSALQSYEDAFKTAVSKFGQLDIVVNNAGIADDISYDKENNVNLTGVMHGTVLAVKYMSKEKGNNGGIVLSTSSVAAVDVIQLIPFYAATKAGVLNLMRGYGNPLHFANTGIRMIALLPGATMDTNIFSNIRSFTTDVQKFLETMTRPTQLSVSVGRAALHLIKSGETGSGYVIEGSKLFILNFPEWESYATLVKENFDTEEQ